MNVLQLRNLSLKLINQYSTDSVPLTTENGDFNLTFVDNLNTAQNKWAEKDKIRSYYTITQDGTEPLVKPYNVYTLPDDYLSMNKITFQESEQEINSFVDYVLNKTTLRINYKYVGEFEVYYTKRPTLLVSDTDIPEIEASYHQYLAYFCAGQWLFSTGKQSDGIVMLNQFDGFLREISPNMDDTISGIVNVTGW